ncbi:MAG: hypothetical protein Q4A28_04210 [Brachymonas sp.]|nr:hypothetical protein [Brachymonas sp.]
MKKILAGTVAAVSLATNPCWADASAEQVKSFFNIYQSICLKHLNNMDEARQKLKPLPALPAKKAHFFLQGMPGTAWPVPDKHGTFVLAIHEKKNFCAVYVRRLEDTEAVEKGFAERFKQAPPPLQAALKEDKREVNANNVPTRTLAYTWSSPGAKHKMLFMLTTSTGADAPLQGVLSASTIND